MGKSRALLVSLLLATGCAEYFYLDLPDVDLEVPADLAARRLAFQEGRENWHGDPRSMADWAIRYYCDVPWKADPYKAHLYEVKSSPEWGTYVTRSYDYPNGEMRYRVKVRQDREIWYPVQVSRYKRVEKPDEHAH